MLTPFKHFFVLAFLIFSDTSTAIAQTPYVELVSIFYKGSRVQCIKDAQEALKINSFKLDSNSSTLDILATYKETKGVLSCSIQNQGQILIVMVGNNHKELLEKLNSIISTLE